MAGGSLLLGEKPDLKPEEVLDLLETTARDFPNGSNCTTTNCGEGIVDAYEALTTLMATLDAPELVAPADGTTINTATPSMEWLAVAGADNYNLDISWTRASSCRDRRGGQRHDLHAG